MPMHLAAVAGQISLPEQVNLRGSNTNCRTKSLRTSESLRASSRRSNARTPRGNRASRNAKTPRATRATRWLKGRKDATLRLAHHSADVASAKIASALHMKVGRKGQHCQSSDNSSDETTSDLEAEQLEQVRVPLQYCDCGFVSAEFSQVVGQSEGELKVTAHDAPLTHEGLMKVFEFADNLLFNAEVSTG